MGAENVTVYKDSMLVVKQDSKEWEVREDKQRLYWDYLATILLSFDQCKFIHLPREENQIADALAILASMWENSAGPGARPVILAKSRSLCYEKIRVMPVQATKKPWYYDLQRYLDIGEFPEDAERKERMSLSMLSR